MGLKEDALAAAQAAEAERLAGIAAARATRIAAARTALGTVLAPTSVDGLEVVDELPTQVVFCGDEVCLAVRDGGVSSTVTLVRDSGGWTRVGEVRSLAELGLLLADGDA